MDVRVYRSVGSTVLFVGWRYAARRGAVANRGTAALGPVARPPLAEFI